MTYVEKLIAATEFLRRGISQVRIVTCARCSQRNRVNQWRLMWLRVGALAKCGRCGCTLMKCERAKP